MSTDSGNGAGGNGGGGGTGERTFTQADVNRLLADERRRTEQKFGDYEQLKRDAEAARRAADSQKSDVDKLTDAVAKLTERAEKAEREATRRDVADRYKLPKSFAKRLSGTTADDLDREARELVEELKSLGVKFDGDGDGGAGSNGSGGDGKDGKDGQGGATGGGSGQGGQGGTGAAGGRPKENLRSGVAGSGSGEETVDAAKIADQVLSQRMF